MNRVGMIKDHVNRRPGPGYAFSPENIRFLARTKAPFLSGAPSDPEPLVDGLRTLQNSPAIARLGSSAVTLMKIFRRHAHESAKGLVEMGEAIEAHRQIGRAHV